MWKNFLHFTQNEKRGLLVLSTLILLVVLANVTLPLWLKSEPVDFTDFKARVDAYYDSLEKEKKVPPTQRKYPPITPFLVDTVNQQWLVDHGLPFYVAKNLISYRDKKGGLSTKMEVAKVYGMNDSIMKAWSSFMVFQEYLPPKKTKNNIPKPDTIPKTKREPEFQIGINTADTALFALLYGIGPAFSNRIVKYRNLLGGFYSIHQISEVYGMDSIRFKKIEPYLFVDSADLRKLEINTASIKSLKNHPYLNFYQAQTIYEYRKKSEWIDNWDTLLSIENLDTSNMSNLKPYIGFKHP